MPSRFRTYPKLSKQDQQASELAEAEEVLRIELPADQQAPPPLYPGEERSTSQCRV